MNYYNNIKDKLTTRKAKHVNYVVKEIFDLRYSIINISLAFGRDKMTEEAFHRKIKNRASLLVKRERYRRRLRTWMWEILNT